MATAIIAFALSLSEPVSARWFVLPGVYYTDELGLIGTFSIVSQNTFNDRIEANLEYYGENQGAIRFKYFVPRPDLEMTFSARYQADEQNAYSAMRASRQGALFTTLRRWNELWIRSDSPRFDGLFYGFEAAYRGYRYNADDGDLEVWGFEPAVSAYYLEGVEYTGSLRIGLERRDDRFNTSQGYYFLWQLDGGGAAADGKTDLLVRSWIDIRRYLSVLNNRSLLALNFRSGIIHHQVPYFSRFKLGGPMSLRGFPLDRYSGNGYYLLRAEWRQMVKENCLTPLHWLKKISPDVPDPRFTAGFVVFSDMGDMWREDLGWWGLRQGIGAGLRAIFPPSVVASLDVAKPVDSGYVTFYLSLEQSF